MDKNLFSRLYDKITAQESMLIINYSPIYYFSLLFGVLPFTLDKNSADGGNFKQSNWGIGYCYLFFAVNLYTGYDILKNTILAFFKYESCFDEICSMNVCRNICAHITILWMNYVANSVSSLSILFIRREKTLQCINDAYNLLKSRLYAQKFTLSAWSILFFMTVNWFAFFFHWKNSHFDFKFIPNYLPLYVMQSLPTVTENLVSVMLLVTELSFRDLNRRIEEITNKKYFVRTLKYNAETKYLINHLKKYYMKCTDLSDRISNCFGFDFLVAGFCSAIRLIYFLFLTLKYAAEQSVVNEDGGFIWPRQEAFVFFLAVVGKFYYLCYRCDGVVSESEKMVSNVLTWLNKLRYSVDKTNREQVMEFLNLIQCRVISVDACSFFTLNLRLMSSVVGLTITYFIVLMQFQVSHLG